MTLKILWSIIFPCHYDVKILQAQYLFIYNSLLRVHTHGRTDVRQKDLKDHIEKLATPISDDSDKTLLDKEFSQVTNINIPVDSFFTVATEYYNESKNRNMDNIPCKQSFNM